MMLCVSSPCVFHRPVCFIGLCVSSPCVFHRSIPCSASHNACASPPLGPSQHSPRLRPSLQPWIICIICHIIKQHACIAFIYIYIYICTHLCSVYLSARPRPDFGHPAGFGMRAGERSGGQAVGRLCVSSCCVFHHPVCFIVPFHVAHQTTHAQARPWGQVNPVRACGQVFSHEFVVFGISFLGYLPVLETGVHIQYDVVWTLHIT